MEKTLIILQVPLVFHSGQLHPTSHASTSLVTFLCNLHLACTELHQLKTALQPYNYVSLDFSTDKFFLHQTKCNTDKLWHKKLEISLFYIKLCHLLPSRNVNFKGLIITSTQVENLINSNIERTTVFQYIMSKTMCLVSTLL